jgi:hypothetical protein
MISGFHGDPPGDPGIPNFAWATTLVYIARMLEAGKQSSIFVTNRRPIVPRVHHGSLPDSAWRFHRRPFSLPILRMEFPSPLASEPNTNMVVIGGPNGKGYAGYNCSFLVFAVMICRSVFHAKPL